MRATATLPRAIARVRASQNRVNGIDPMEPNAFSKLADSYGMGFTRVPAKPQPLPEPRRVPIGFVPGQTTAQIQIAR